MDSLVCCLRPCPSGTASSSYGNMTKYRGHCTSHYRGSTVAGSISSHQCWCCFPETEICRPTSSLNPIPLYFFFSTAVICIYTTFLFLAAIYKKNFSICSVDSAIYKLVSPKGKFSFSHKLFHKIYNTVLNQVHQ